MLNYESNYYILNKQFMFYWWINGKNYKKIYYWLKKGIILI